MKYLLSILFLLFNVAVINAAHAQSQNEVQITVLFDGASNFTAGEPTAPTGVAPEPHVAGTDGGPQNLVVRTHDQFAVRADWNINEDLATAVTFTTILPASAEWTTDDTGGYAGCVTTTFPDPQTAVCELGDQAEGSNGTIRMTALLNESTDNTLFDVPTTLTTGEDAAGVTDGLDQLLTVSAIPIASFRKGTADVAGDPSTGPITSSGEDGILFLYPLSLIDFSQGPNPIVGAGPIGSGQIDFFDHAYRLTDSVTLATQQQMDDAGFVGRTPCGPYDGVGAFPITPSAAWACGAATTPNGYPVVPITVTGLVASPAPANNADGSPNVVGQGASVLSGQIAFWLPADEVQDEIDDPANDSGLTARFENAIAAQDPSVAITDQADVLPIGVPDASGGTVPEQASTSDPGDDPSENTSRTVLGAAPPASGGPGATIGHHIMFRAGPLQILETQLYNGGARFNLDYRTVGNGGLRGLLPGETVAPGNTNGDSIGDTPRGNTITINSQVLTASNSPDNIWDAPIQGCTAFDTTHYNLVAFGDIPVTQTDGAANINPPVTGGSIVQSNTGPLAHVYTGSARSLQAALAGQQNAVGGNLAGLDYTVEFTDAPLELLPGGNFGVNNDELTCNDSDAGASGWVDATDVAGLAVFNTDGDPTTFDGITRARVRITQRFPWTQGPNGVDETYNGFQAFFQAMVKADLAVQTVNQELFALQSHSFGELGPDGVPDLQVFEGSTLPVNCRPYQPAQWIATGSSNDVESTTGYCNNEFVDDGANSLDDTDLVDWDNDSSTRFSQSPTTGITTFLNASGAVITIVEANLGLSKTNRDGLADIADNGDTVEFILTPRVVGSTLEALTNVRLSDNLPANYEFVAFTQPPTTPGSTCTAPTTPSGTINCQFSEPNPAVDTGDLAAGLPGGWSDEIRFEVVVVGAIADPDSPTVITNTARIESTALGPWDPATEVFIGPIAPGAKNRVSSARSFLPLPADESVVVKAVAPLRGVCEVIPAGFAGTLAEWQERCSLINIDEEMSFDLTVENEGNTALTRLEFIDVFPHLPDGPGTEDVSDTTVNQLGSSRPATIGDGRTPESDFAGDVSFVSLVGTTLPAGSALTVLVTGDSPDDVSRDPALSFAGGVNTWCDGVGGAVVSGPGACPATDADVTAVYGEISGGVGLLPGDTASLSLTLGNENSACGDLWTNTFGLRSDEIFLPIRSNDVSVQVACPMSIGSYVWFDEDQDGLQDSSATDVPIAGTTFTLWVEDAPGTFVAASDVVGAPVPAQTSVADGLYFFDNLPSGNYKVQATPPAGFQPTPPQTPGNDDDTENDSNIAIIITPATPATSGVFESGVFALVPDSEPLETDAFAGDDADTATAIGSLEDINGNMTIDFGFFIPEPEINLVKTAGVPVLNDDGTYDVAYTMLIENIGNVDLNNLSLVDDLEAAFTAAAFTGSDSAIVSGGIIVPPVAAVSLDAPGTAIALPVGDVTYGGSAATNANLFTAGPSVLGVGDIIAVTFTARLNPAALALSPLTNTAETAGTDAFGTSVDDPASAIIDLPAPAPLLGLTKAAGVPIINEDGTIDVVYTLQIENQGDVDLMDISLVDDLFTQFEAQAAGSYTASDATVSATGVTVAPVVALVTDAPGTAVVLPTAEVAYEAGPAANGLFTAAPSTLGVGDIIEVVFTVRLNPEAGGITLTNTADTAGTDPFGTVLGATAAADVLAELLPEISLTKAAGTPILNADGTIDVPYTIVAENTGNVQLTDITLVDDLLSAFGAVAYTASDDTVDTDGIIVAPVVTLIEGATGTSIAAGIAGDPAYTGAAPLNSVIAPIPLVPDVLGISDQIEVVFTARLNPEAAELTPLTNTAEVGGTDPAGTAVDADASVEVELVPLEPSLILSKIVAGPPVDLGGGVYQVIYNFMVENDGNVDITNLQITDDLNAMINNPNPNGGVVSDALVTYVSGTTLTPSPTFTGLGNNNMLTGTDVYPVGSTTELTLSFTFVPDAYFGPFLNTAQVSGEDPTGATTMDNSEESNAPTSGVPGEDIQSPTPFSLSVPATPITLGWIQITDNANGSAMIEWQTATEIANAGFRILVKDESGDWLPVNTGLIESQGDSTSPQNYEYNSERVGEEYMLVDVSVTGVEVRHGPFKLNESHGIHVTPKNIEWERIQQESDSKQEQREQQRRKQLQDRLSERDRSGGLLQAIAGAVLTAIIPSAHAADLVTFEVESAGLYKVSHQDLISTGLDLRGIELSRLGLEEASVLWPMDKVQDSGTVFTSDTQLLFPARGLDSLYSGVNKYTLVLDEGSLGINDDAQALPGNDIALAYSYLAETTYAPQNNYSHLSPEDDDSWFADALNAINSPAQKSVTLSVDGYVPPLNFSSNFGAQIQRQATQNPELEVSMWGGSALPGNGVTNPDHHVLIELNGEALESVRFDGLSHKLEQAPLVSVNEGSNVLDITVPNDQGYLYDLIRLDHVTLRYPRTFDAQQNALVFESQWNKFRVSKLNTNDARVVRLAQDGTAYYMTERGDGQCTTGCIYFSGDASSSNTYFLATDVGLKTPTVSVAVDGSSLASTAANFIIIAHPDFINTDSQSLEGYASEVSAQYGSVDIVDVETIYAAYSGGVVDAYAIKSYISDAYENRGARHILLVGGDSYDYQNFTNSGAKSFIPSIYQPISNNVKAVPSDSSYVLVDDDLSPDLTISRLPVRTSNELDNLIIKRQNYLARNYQNNVLMVADEIDNSRYSFKADAQSLISDSFASNNVSQVYLDDMDLAAARTSVISAINGGVSFASYFGHSSTDRWSISSVLSGDDVAGLANSQSPTVIAQWGCWNTFYVSPEHDSMAHRFLLEGTQGAVTVMGASSFTQADAEKRMAEYLSVNLQQGMRIGDAVQDAKQKIYNETPFQMDVLLGWAVLGFDDMAVFE